MIEGRTHTSRRVAGAPVTPVTPTSENVPGWLVTSAGWSWRLIVLVAAVALVVYATASIQLVFIAVFLGLVVTAVLRPVVDLFAKIMPRPLATALGMLSAVALVGGLLTYVVASVATQWESLSQQFSQGIDQIFDYLNDGPLPINVTSTDLNDWVNRGQEWIQSHAGVIAGTAFEQAGSVVEVFTGFALAIFCAVFFLTSGHRMWGWFLGQLPQRTRASWSAAAGAGWYTFSGYTRGTVIIALTDGLLAGIFLAILGVPLAAPLGVLVFIGAFIPLIGAPLAMVVAMVVALASHGIWKAAIVGIGIAAIGQLEGHVLQPLIMGKQVSLHPVVIALAVASGTLVAGILGAVISVPLIAVIWSIYSRLRQQHSTDTSSPPSTQDEVSEDEEAAEA